MGRRIFNLKATTTKGVIIFCIFLWELSPLSLLSQISEQQQQQQQQQQHPFGNQQQCLEKKRSVAFAKTHRTGGSTLQNILLRFGLNNDLTFAFPPKVSWLFPLNTTFEASMVLNSNWSIYLKFDLFLSHSKWSYSEVLKVVPNATFITLLRDPIECFESNFVFMGMGMDINSFAQNYAAKNHKRHKDDHVGQNQLLWDLGLSAEETEDVNTIERRLAEFDQQFDLVLITEMYKESIVLMKEKLCWDMKDVTYLRQLERVEEKRCNMTDETKEILRKWLWADYLVYDHFLAKLKKEVKDYGAKKMEASIAELDKCNEEVAIDCNIKHKTEDAYGKSLGMKTYSADKNRKECLAYVMSEIDFSKLIRQYQDYKIIWERVKLIT